MVSEENHVIEVYWTDTNILKCRRWDQFEVLETQQTTDDPEEIDGLGFSDEEHTIGGGDGSSEGSRSHNLPHLPTDVWSKGRAMQVIEDKLDIPVLRSMSHRFTSVELPEVRADSHKGTVLVGQHEGHSRVGDDQSDVTIGIRCGPWVLNMDEKVIETGFDIPLL